MNCTAINRIMLHCFMDRQVIIEMIALCLLSPNEHHKQKFREMRLLSGWAFWLNNLIFLDRDCIAFQFFNRTFSRFVYFWWIRWIKAKSLIIVDLFQLTDNERLSEIEVWFTVHLRRWKTLKRNCHNVNTKVINKLQGNAVRLFRSLWQERCGNPRIVFAIIDNWIGDK